MGARRGQKLKILYIIDILRKYSDEDHPISANEICERLSELDITAERKAIYDDIQNLMDFGYDIIKTRIPKAGYFLASREFETPEIFLLGDAVRTAKFITPKKSRKLVNKLQDMLSVYQRAGAESGIYVDSDSKCKNEEIFYNIDTISQAISQKKKISFTYCVRTLENGREIELKYKKHKISPYAMTWQDDHYYLIGNYEKYDNLVHFRIDRMHSVEITDENYRHFSEVSDYSDCFDIADYTRKLFNMYGGELTEIDLKCNKDLLEQIADRFGNQIFIRNVTESHFSFTAKAVVSDAFVTYILNFGDKIEVLNPPEVRDMIKERIYKIQKLYK